MKLRDKVEKKLEELRTMFRELDREINELPEWKRGEYILRKEKLESKMYELEEWMESGEFDDSLEVD